MNDVAGKHLLLKQIDGEVKIVIEKGIKNTHVTKTMSCCLTYEVLQKKFSLGLMELNAARKH